MLKPDAKPACDDEAYHPDQWFPDGPERGHVVDKQEEKRQLLNAVEALEVCATCPIKQACLDFSFSSPDTINYGIYGGTLAYERRLAVGNKHTSTHGYIFQRRIRKLAASRGVRIPAIGKRERGATWLSEQPELNVEFIQRGQKLAQEQRQQEQA